MNVSCPDCGSVFRVDPAKVAPEGVRAKCSICGGVIAIAGRDEHRDAPAAPRPTPVVAGFAVDARAMTPLSETPVSQTPISAAPIVAPPAPALSDVESAAAPEPNPVFEPIDTFGSDAPVEILPPAEEPEVESPSAAEPAEMTSEPIRPLTPVAEAPIVAPPPPAPVARPALTPPVRSATPRTTMPTAVPPATPGSVPAFGGFRPGPAGIAGTPRPAPPAAPAAPAEPPAAQPDAAPSAADPTPASVARTPTPISHAATPLFTTPVAGGETLPPRRPVNPFLANDPSAKAKRLARALVSDMIAYLPQKREEGLRDGTLKQIFREEIKKSYEEYVDQIGREIAENTTHFQEALNDLLAGGQKIF